MPGLRSTRSAVNARVTLVELDSAVKEGSGARSARSARGAHSAIPPNMLLAPRPSESTSPRPSSSGASGPAIAPTSDTTAFTSLRRTTRSLAPSTPPSPPPAPLRTPQIDLSSYAYPQAATPPRKRIKREPLTPLSNDPAAGADGSAPRETTPINSIEGDDVKPALPAPASAKKKPMPLLKLEKPHPEPARWREQYALIEHMRRGIVAPVDDMGCERPQTMVDADPKTMRFHILISLMLSSQTKDAITSQAVTNLHTSLPGGLTAESLANAPAEQVMDCINKVGFWRRKTDYIQEAARRLLERPGDQRGDVPDTLEELCELRGVGPKMAFLALQCAWDINAGIGVDVHVHRITNRLKWHKPPTTDPEKTRLNLQSWLPPSLHKPINPLLVGFGQVVCLPVGPRCDICLLGKRKLCPSRVAVNPRGRKEVVYTFVDDMEDTAVKLERMVSPDQEAGQGVGVKDEPGHGHEVKVEVAVEDGPLAKVEIGYAEGPLVKLEEGVVSGRDP